ncbi:MAG: hypothetical protein WD490_05145 [Opitutales bacterium]
MKRKRRYPFLRSPWLLAFTGTILIHAGAIFVIDLAPVEEVEPLAFQRPFVLFADAGSAAGERVQAEQAALLDSAPLFLPSQWNTMSPFVAGVRERTLEDVFTLFPPEFFFDAADLAAGVAVDTGEPRNLQEHVFEWNRDSLQVMGRRDAGEPASAGRFALLEAVLPGAPKPAVSYVISREAVTEGFTTFWEPAEFSVIVDSLGIAGSPLLLQGSGEAHVDQLLERLVDGFLLEKGGGLDPGYYQIFIGP